MDKKKLSEADICLKFITPARVASGWNVNEQVFQEFTLKAGRMVARRLCADLRERLQQARATQSRLADALVSAAAQSLSC